jgi:thiol-disulfide isomerase/thioredoxin
MKKKLSWIIIAVLLVGLIGGASVLYEKYSGEVEMNHLAVEESVQSEPSEDSENKASEDSSMEEKELVMAPDFTVYDAEGNAVKLSDYIGKPTIVNFWASWCGPCKMEMPDFQDKFLQLGNEINFLMINMTDGARETVETASSFIADQGYTFPVFYDTNSEAAYVYGAYSLPTTYFINAQGHAIAQAVGAIDADTLQQGIDMITTQE